jgi:hypothetical protein
MSRLVIKRENFEFNKFSSLDIASMLEKNIKKDFHSINI